jgi:hypothetical protein
MTLRAGVCFGIVIGVANMMDLYNETLLKQSCLKNVTYGLILTAVVDYINRHPERAHEDFYILAWEAMQKAWPCQPTPTDVSTPTDAEDVSDDVGSWGWLIAYSVECGGVVNSRGQRKYVEVEDKHGKEAAKEALRKAEWLANTVLGKEKFCAMIKKNIHMRYSFKDYMERW